MQKIIEENKVVYKTTKKHISFYDKVLAEEAVEKVDMSSVEFSEHALQNMKKKNLYKEFDNRIFKWYNVINIK